MSAAESMHDHIVIYRTGDSRRARELRSRSSGPVRRAAARDIGVDSSLAPYTYWESAALGRRIAVPTRRVVSIEQVDA